MIKKKANKENAKAKKEKQIPVESTSTPNVWNPLELFDNMDRYLWDDPWTPSFWKHRPSMNLMKEHWFDTDTKISPLDLVDIGDKYKVIAEIPGVPKKDLDVNITSKKISICGETKTETNEEDIDYVRHERRYSTICRNMSFPEEVDPNKAEATLKDGILEIQVYKKSPQSKGRKIPIK